MNTEPATGLTDAPIYHFGRLVGWAQPDGRIFPHITGAAEGDPPDPENPPPDPDDPPKDPPPDPDEDDPAKEAAKWKALARKHEERAKANAKAQKELDDLRKKSMSDQEKAVEEAKEAGRKEATIASGEKLAAARIETALTGLVEDPSLIVEDLNLAKFVNDDGDVDTDKVTALKEKYAALKPGTGKPLDLGQGRRPGNPAGSKADAGRAEALKRFGDKSK